MVPTYREAANLPLLIPRVAAALAGLGGTCEIIVVDDDSRDGTEEAIARLAETYPVRLITRTSLRDLSLAALDGLRAARGERLVVMDADLSHPPEAIPQLLAGLHDHEMVIGSRYVPGGQTQNWGGHRRLNSYVATALALPLARGVRDPMAGFFAIRRAVLERARDLRPVGYKIGLELLCRGEPSVAEVPITFPDRAHGQSKLNLRQQARYLVHLDRLYREYRRGWGLVLRPVIWAMLGAVVVLNRCRPFMPR